MSNYQAAEEIPVCSRAACRRQVKKLFGPDQTCYKCYLADHPEISRKSGRVEEKRLRQIRCRQCQGSSITAELRGSYYYRSCDHCGHSWRVLHRRTAELLEESGE